MFSTGCVRSATRCGQLTEPDPFEALGEHGAGWPRGAQPVSSTVRTQITAIIASRATAQVPHCTSARR